MSFLNQLKGQKVYVLAGAVVAIILLSLGIGLGVGLQKTKNGSEISNLSNTPVLTSPSTVTAPPTSAPTRAPTTAPRPTSAPRTTLAPRTSSPTVKVSAASTFVFVVNGGSSSISVIDLSTDTVTKNIKLNGSYPHHASMSPDKKKLIVGLPGIDLSGGHSMTSLAHGAVHGNFVVLDSTTLATIKTVELPVSNHNSIYSPDGTEIWSGQMAKNGTVLVYDSTSYKLKTTILAGLSPVEVTFSSDGLTGFVCNNAMAGTVGAINVKTKKLTTTFSVEMTPIGAWPGSNNKMYVDNVMSKTISIIDATTLKKEPLSIALTFEPGMVAYNKLDNTVWVTDETNGAVVVFSNRTAVTTITAGAGTHGIVFNANYTKAYVTNQEANTVSVINAVLRKKIKDITVGTKPNGMVVK